MVRTRHEYVVHLHPGRERSTRCVLLLHKARERQQEVAVTPMYPSVSTKSTTDDKNNTHYFSSAFPPLSKYSFLAFLIQRSNRVRHPMIQDRLAEVNHMVAFKKAPSSISPAHPTLLTQAKKRKERKDAQLSTTTSTNFFTKVPFSKQPSKLRTIP